MIDNNLISYIEQNLKRGYSASAILNALTNQGYPAQNVIDTINYVLSNNQNILKTANQSQSSSKKVLFILIPVVLIIIIGLSIFSFMSFSPKSISEEDFSKGTNFDLKENKEVKFNLDEGVHSVKVNSINDDSVSLTIQSNTIKVDLRIGEEKKFDLDNDGFYDIKIKLNNIVGGIPNLYIKNIHESTCVENWNCGSWSDCTEQGKQTRTCTDANSCGTEDNKPSTMQSCTYIATCSENWECSDWSSCVSGQKTRTCTDSNSCGTTDNKPDEQQSCQVQMTDCGSNVFSQENQGNMPNFDCFINASKNCNPTKLLNTASMEIFGMLSTSTTYMELKGMESNKCIYYQRTESNSLKFTEQRVQQMLDGGATQKEIDQQEQTANDSAQQAVGMEKTCNFDTKDLTAMLNRWKQGNMSDEDWNVAECEGDY